MSNLYNYYTKNHGLFNSWDSATRQADVTRATNAGVDFGGAYTGGEQQNIDLYNFLTSDQSATNPEKETYIENQGNAETGSSSYTGGSDYTGGSSYTGGTGSGTTGSTPTGNTGPTAADLAYEEYIKSLIPSDETTAANKALREHDTQAALDREKALESGETLGFARGEAGYTDRQNAILRGGAAASAQAYAALDAQKQTMTKARYEYEKAKIDEEAGKNPDFTISEGQSKMRYNPETGKYEEIASKGKTYAPKAETAYERDKQMNDDVSNVLSQLVKQAELTGGSVSKDDYSKVRSWVLTNYGAAGLEILSDGLISGRIRIK